MSSIYPEQIDNSATLPIVTDKVTEVDAAVFNPLRDAAIKIESELGINPSGTYGTVKARLDDLDVRDDVFETRISDLEVRVTDLENSGGGGGGGGGISAIEVSEDGISLSTAITELNFTGSGVGVTTLGNTATITITDVGITGSPSKIRVYRNTSDLAGASVTNNQTITWNATSSFVSINNSTLTGGNTQLTAGATGHFLVSGNFTINPTTDSISSIIIEIILNSSTIIHTINDTGAVWGIDKHRSFNFSIPIDLLSSDYVWARWRHFGSPSSATELLAGESLSWFAISQLR